MSELESSRHLFQPPIYKADGSSWQKALCQAALGHPKQLTWDTAAVLGILSFNYVTGDRTLLNEVKRRPWLAKIDTEDKVILENIPAHDLLMFTPQEIAEKLYNLLCEEACEVCRGRKEIYILLSGGLDSRIVAGILHHLYQQGKLESKPVGVTWGLEQSRDVVYGKQVAELLGFGWQHIPLTPQDLLFNTKDFVINIGAMAAPNHLHSMHWFKNVSPEALVLAGSYGDSVGRAEFSGRHVLELNYLQPCNTYNLLRPEVQQYALQQLTDDLKALHERSGNQPKYVLCEHEMQAHYMRNHIAHIMSVINRYCTMYQLFTHPRVYSYMWSLHPAIRNDSIYAALLKKLGSDLARLPWARNNKALRGATVGAQKHLLKKFHDYAAWVNNELFDELDSLIEVDWFAATGIFSPEAIKALTTLVREGKNGQGMHGFRPYEKWLWLGAFRSFADYLEKQGKSVTLDASAVNSSDKPPFGNYRNQISLIRRWAGKSTLFCQVGRRAAQIRKQWRRKKIKNQAVIQYPPKKT